MIKSVSMPLAASLMAALLLSSAAPVSAADPPSAPRPTLLVGDRWVYNVTSGVGLTKTTYQETRDVTTVDASGIKVKVTGKTVDGKDFTRVEDLPAAGELRSGGPCIDQAYRISNRPSAQRRYFGVLLTGRCPSQTTALRSPT